MANRFPLIVDSSGTAAIKELASGDNLDLTGNGIVGAGTVALTNLTVGGSQGTDGQVLTSTGSGIAWEDASGGSSTFGVSTMTGDGSDTTLTLSADPGSENNTQVYIDGVYQPKSSYSVSGTTLTFSTAPPNNTSVEAIVGASVAAGVPSDASVTSAKLSGALTMPSSLTLGGNLDVSGHDIVTASNGAIDLDPHGSGVVTFKGNSTRGAGQFKLNCENNSHGITIKGPPHSASASYTLTLPNSDGNANQVLKTDGSGNLDWVDSGGGGGAWTRLSTTTVSSGVSSVEITLTGSYTQYAIWFSGINFGANGNYIQCKLANQNGTYPDLKWIRFGYGGDTGGSDNKYAHSGAFAAFLQTGASLSTANGSIAGHMNIFNISGQPTCIGQLSNLDDGQSLDIGLTNYTFGFAAPGSSDTISKVKFEGDAGNNIQDGTFVLYGIATS